MVGEAVPDVASLHPGYTFFYFSSDNHRIVDFQARPAGPP